MADKDADPLRKAAKLALDGEPHWCADTLEEVIAYCWDQLCYRRATEQLIEFRSLNCSLGDDEEA